MACDMPESCEIPSRDSCQKRFPSAHKELDLALLSVVGPVLQVGDAEKFPHALGLERLDSFLRVRKQGPCLATIEENGVYLVIAAIAEAILMRPSVGQVPCLHRAAPRHLKLVTFSNFWPFMLIFALMLLACWS